MNNNSDSIRERFIRATRFLRWIGAPLDDEEELAASIRRSREVLAMPPEEVERIMMRALENAIRQVEAEQQEEEGRASAGRQSQKAMEWVRGRLSELLAPGSFPEPAPVLGRSSDSDVADILLADVLDESVLQEQLPWAGDRLRIRRYACDPGVAKYTGEMVGVATGQTSGGGALRLVLTAQGLEGEPEKKAEVLLTCEQPNQWLVGDELPSDWEKITAELTILKAERHE